MTAINSSANVLRNETSANDILQTLIEAAKIAPSRHRMVVEESAECWSRADLLKYAHAAAQCADVQLFQIAELTKLIAALTAAAMAMEKNQTAVFAAVETALMAANVADNLSGFSKFKKRKEMDRLVRDLLDQIIQARPAPIEWPNLENFR